MKTLHPGLAAHLAGGVTTLARCWRLTRRDGVVMGFTDHDGDLAFDTVVHRARSGLEPSEAEAELGFAIASLDVAGVLHSAGLTEADIARGLFDGAEVEIWLVDWSNPDNRQRLDVMVIGEITRGDAGFVAELRSAAHRFDEERGRLFTGRCGADLGDARCRWPVVPVPAVVSASTGPAHLVALGLGAHADGWFTGGKLAFTSGPNAGQEVEIRRHGLDGAAASFDLWLDMPHPVEVGNTVLLTPGCDKSFVTCREKFNNGVNFQGFPHMPGTDYLLQVVEPGAPRRFDGGSLFR
jgi:uncharacterized phage protein (TIGR02218 family)